MKTISIPEELHKQIIELKLEEREKNVAGIIKRLIISYREQKFLELSQKFRGMLKREGKSFSDFLKESRKIKEEVADEWF